MSGGVWYAARTRVRKVGEEVFEPQNEAWLQRLWFEEVYRDVLTTEDGETVRILQPGLWNHGPGPDFLHAALINGKGQREVGAVEIHRDPADWDRHGHGEDLRYGKVILHVVWQRAAGEHFTRTCQHRQVRVVYLPGQLRRPPAELGGLFTSLPRERVAGVRVGRCQSALMRLSLAQRVALIEQAGWARFAEKRALWQARRSVLGTERALWLGLFEALGYGGNQEPFRLLAQRLDRPTLAALNPLQAEAMLFGVAGFLPTRRLPAHAAAWARGLWDEWWQQRAAWADLIIPPETWKRAGVRPTNRPERRLAVAALLVRRPMWKTFTRLVAEGEPEALGRFMAELSHPFWDRQLSLTGRPTAKRTALLGASRLAAFLYNVVWPLSEASEDQIQRWLTTARNPLTHQSSRRAYLRLLDRGSLGRDQHRLLIQEGLLRIYQDFCLQDANERCVACTFPELVEDWAQHTSDAF